VSITASTAEPGAVEQVQGEVAAPSGPPDEPFGPGRFDDTADRRPVRDVAPNVGAGPPNSTSFGALRRLCRISVVSSP
jgi:hypothetical protein